MPRRGGAASRPPFSQSVKSNDHPSKDLRAVPLIKRKTLLERLLKPHPRLNYVDHVEGHGVGMYAGALALGLEGIVAKDAKSRPLVTWHWQKIKNKEYKRQGKVEFGQSKARR